MKIKSTIWWTLSGVFVLLLVFFPAASQTSDKEKAGQEQKKQQELERKTYALVEEIAGAALSLKLPENRLYVLAATGDLLWAHDEPHARNLFWDALNTINLVNSSASTGGDKETKKLTTKERQQRLQHYFSVYALKRELLQRVARRDPQLALDMLRSSRQVAIEPMPEGFLSPDDRELEQQIAAEAVDRDPERALQLARESLSKGLSYQLFDPLFRLNQRDPKLGTRFAGEILEKLRNRNFGTDPHAARLAISLLGLSRVREEVPNKNGSGAALRQLNLEPDQKRELVNLLTNAALETSADANVLYAIEDIRPEIEQFAPERMPLIKRKLAAFTQTLNPQQKFSLESGSLMRSGSPEDMLKLANRQGEEHREYLQQQAIDTAVVTQRADSLRTFINSEISDEGRRKEMLDSLDSQQIDYAMYKGDVAGLRKLVPEIRRKETRARVMAEIAAVLAKKGEQEEAVKLLDEAQTLVKNDLNSESQTNAILALMAAYALVEPGRAFTMLERIIDDANGEVSKALFWDRIAKSGAVKNGELRMAQSGMIPIDFVALKYGPAVSALAQADFDRTRAAADRFERYELRLMARLVLAQALLTGKTQEVKEADQ